MNVDTEAKNLIRNEDGVTIDMEINHPIYGWIPFTASPDDIEEHGRAIHAAAESGELGAIQELK